LPTKCNPRWFAGTLGPSAT